MNDNFNIINIEKNNEDLEDDLKWDLLDNLNLKDKLKLNLLTKYNKIIPILFYSSKILLKNNKYINLLSSTTSLLSSSTNLLSSSTNLLSSSTNLLSSSTNLLSSSTCDILCKSTDILCKSTIIMDKTLVNIADYSSQKIKTALTPFFESIKLQYNYNQAFKYAYYNIINICYNLILPSLIDINKNLYKNYNKEIIIDNFNNEFVIIYCNYKYVFVYHQFLLNKGFQIDLQNYINKNIINLNLIFKINEYNNFIIELNYEI